MKKIIIIAIAVVAAIVPFQGSFASAADGSFFGSGASDGSFFGSGSTNQPFGNTNPYGVNGDPFGVGSNDNFFGSGSTNQPFGVNDTDPFAPCNNDVCLDPCEWRDCGCDYGCDDPCDCYDSGPTQYDDVHVSHHGTPAPVVDNTNTNENVNNNVNQNEINIIIKNYIQGGGSPAADTRNVVANRNKAPIFSSTPVTTAAENRPYSYRAVATDADSDLLSYTLLSAPNGMTISSRTGLVEWTPSTSQGGVAYQVVISVTDGTHQASQVYQIFVQDSVVVRTGGPGRVAGTAIAVAEASDRSELHAYNIRVDTDESGNSIVTWDTTEPSRGRVIFGRATQGDRTGTDFTGANQYEFATENSPETSTSHRIALGELEAERVYYFRVVSFAGTQTDVSSERSFVQLGNGETLNSDAGFASVIGTLGSFIVSPWFLLLIVILIVLIIFFRRRDREIIAHAPVEMHVGGGHH